MQIQRNAISSPLEAYGPITVLKHTKIYKRMGVLKSDKIARRLSLLFPEAIYFFISQYKAQPINLILA